MKEDTTGPTGALHADSEFDTPNDDRAEALWSEPTQHESESESEFESESEAAPAPSRTHKKKRRKKRRRRSSSRAKTTAKTAPANNLFMGVSQ
ncbi:MAG: hypothetical protein AAGF11_39290 [Myxococcota bacterium]